MVELPNEVTAGREDTIDVRQRFDGTVVLVLVFERIARRFAGELNESGGCLSGLVGTRRACSSQAVLLP